MVLLDTLTVILTAIERIAELIEDPDLLSTHTRAQAGIMGKDRSILQEIRRD
jgi:hypothetical protein